MKSILLLLTTSAIEHIIIVSTGTIIITARCYASAIYAIYAVSQWPSGNMPDCGVRGPRFESHRRRLCLSRQPLRYTALGTGCTPLLQCLG